MSLKDEYERTKKDLDEHSRDPRKAARAAYEKRQQNFIASIQPLMPLIAEFAEAVASKKKFRMVNYWLKLDLSIEGGYVRKVEPPPDNIAFEIGNYNGIFGLTKTIDNNLEFKFMYARKLPGGTTLWELPLCNIPMDELQGPELRSHFVHAVRLFAAQSGDLPRKGLFS